MISDVITALFRRKNNLIFILPVTIVIYSVLIVIFLFDKKTDFVLPLKNVFEALIPAMVGMILAVQFYFYFRNIQKRNNEIRVLKEQIEKYEAKIKNFKKTKATLKNEIKNQINYKDYNYSIVRLSFLIENELQRLIKKEKLRGEKPVSIRAMTEYLVGKNKIPYELANLLFSINHIRNNVIHGVGTTKDELRSYIELAQIALKTIGNIR